MLKLLPVNIRMFDDGEGEETNNDFDMDTYFSDGEFDVDKFRADFEASHEEEVTDEEQTEETDTETTEEQTSEEETETETDEEQTEEQTDEEETDEPSFQNEKQNQAFAKMRKQLEEEQKLSSFVKQLADQQGVSPEQLMEAYQQRQLEQQAKEQNVPVDVLKRINQLEEENQQAKRETFATKFNSEVEATRTKYNLDDKQTDEVFRYMVDNGYIDNNKMATISFEDAYVLANKDNLINQAKEQGRQEYLEQKRQKQQSATVPTGDGGSPQETNPSDFTTDDIVKQFREMGLDNPFD